MTALVSLDDFKTYKKLTKTEDDASLGLIINSVSEAVKSYCGHSFIDYYSTAKIEYFSIHPSQDAIILDEWPIRDITSVEYRDTYDASYTVLTSTEYFLDTNNDTLFKHVGYWPEGFASVKVTYRGGYATVPGDIQLAVLDLVSHYFKEEYKERRSIGASSIDNSTRFNSSKFSTSKWPTHVVRVMDMYRNV